MGIILARLSSLWRSRSAMKWRRQLSRLREDEMVKDVTLAGEDGSAEGDRPRAGDGIDRRNFLGCMAWAGTGLLWTFAGGVPSSRLLAQAVKSGANAMHS